MRGIATALDLDDVRDKFTAMYKLSGGLVCVSFCIAATAARAQPALDKAVFSASPKELLAVAAAAPADDHGAVILREEEESSFDAQGRERWRLRRVFVVRTQAGVDDWGTLGVGWSPFYQDRPTIRARVIDPDGSVSELDPKLITDAPQTSNSSTVFSDRRHLDAPLPRIRVGSIVEEELVFQDRQPILPGSGMRTVEIGSYVPTRSTRIVLSTPARKGAFHGANVPGGVKPKYAIKGDRETWTLELGPLPGFEGREPFAPRDVLAQGIVGVSMTSWSSVAREYRKLLDARITAGAFAYPATLPKTKTIETVRAITEWLHKNVRYTGIEFDEASNIPWTPAETVKRGFGDCKDKATLLIALLRQIGIRADLVLLSTGPGLDVVKELPGMGVFDHAIVRAQLGTTTLWIDATEDLLLPGQLPSRDQTRRALVIADETTALADTPGASPADNTIKETRTFELSEDGNATRVTEVSMEGGVFNEMQRSWVRTTKASDLQKELGTYVENKHLAKFVRHTTTAVEDLATPFAITVEMKDSQRAFTARGKIDVYLFPNDTLLKVPATAKEADKQRPRKSDFVWYTPHVYEIENRLVLPPGFTMPTLPAERIFNLGAAKLTERHRIDGNTLVVTFRFDSGKSRITPAELAAMQKEIAVLGETKTQVVIEHTGWSLAERGKWKEAIAEIQRLIALHPKEAVHHTQLAFVMIRAGMGTAARRAARKAVEIEPNSADAHVVLGWVLRHDSLGRELTFDFDRAGSIAALRKARKLDPKHIGAASDLATTLQRDATGTLYGPGADLPGAAEAWTAALALDDSEENAISLARVLLYAKRYPEMEALLRKRATSEMRDSLLVAAIAGASGPKAAIEAAGRLRAGDARTTILAKAGMAMVIVREYERARPLLAETNMLAPGSPFEAIMRKIKRYDRKAIADRDPRAPIADVISFVIDRNHKTRFMWDATTSDEEESTAKIRDATLQQLRSLSLTFLEDVLHSITETKVDGTGPWRVEIDMLGQRGKYYAALDGNVAKLVGSPEHPRGVGRHVFRLLAAKQDAKAIQLIDWLIGDIPNSPMLALWKPGVQRDKATIALAAALLAGSTASKDALPVLERCESTLPDVRELCDGEIAGILVSDRKYRELEQHASAWLGRKPQSPRAIALRIYALGKLGRFDDADKVFANAKLDDEHVIDSHGDVATARGDFDEAFRRYEPLVKKGHPYALNQRAWLTVVAEKDLQRGLELAARAAGPDKTKAESAILNTLAAVEAELGHLSAAKDDGWQAMDNRRRNVPESQDWYIVGRIAEQLGLRDDAIDAYRKVTLEPKSSQPSISTFALAQRRLRKLGVTK